MPLATKKTDCRKIKVSAEIKDYGLGRGEIEEIGFDKLTPTRAYTNYKNIVIQERTNRIKATNGNMMYFIFKLSNLPKGKTIGGLKIQTSFPEMTNDKGLKFNSFVRRMDAYKEANQTEVEMDYYWAFLDQFPFEMVEGKWTFQILYKDCELSRIVFFSYR